MISISQVFWRTTADIIIDDGGDLVHMLHTEDAG